jgi:AbrB family looped-hinge helix DNA binding protein
MTTTVLSSKGQVIIPKLVRAAHHWMAGEKLIVVDTAEGVLLKPFSRLKKNRLEDVAGCLHYAGPAKSVEEMAAGLQRSVKATFK